MAEVSTSLRSLLRIIFVITTSLLVSSLSSDVEYKIKAGSSEFKIELVNVEGHRRLRREVNASATEGSSVSSTPVLTSPSPSPSTPQSTTPIPTTPQAETPQPSPTTPQSTTTTPAPTTTPIPNYVNDSHTYYTSEVVQSAVDAHWIELPSSKQHKTLSQSHRTAVTIDLKFPFRFYGHNITNVTVATGGFIYTSPFLHQWLTATQYIAPLMANFDTRQSNVSGVYYDNSDERFVVQWKSVFLQNDSSPFDFEVIMTTNGSIKFLYKNIPKPVQSISNKEHPVKVGLSDAFYIDSFLSEYGIRRRTIYEYHRVALQMDRIQSGTVIILEPLPTCNTISDCGECIIHQNVKFECNWCQNIQRCSDGFDWHRQTWLQKGCKDTKNNKKQCPPTTPDIDMTTVGTTSTVDITDGKTPTPKSKPGFPVGALLAVLLILVIVVSLGAFFFYAYTHPHSKPGMWLLENRPSQMKEKLSKMAFWKKNTPAGTQYQVESTA